MTSRHAVVRFDLGYERKKNSGGGEGGEGVPCNPVSCIPSQCYAENNYSLLTYSLVWVTTTPTTAKVCLIMIFFLSLLLSREPCPERVLVIPLGTEQMKNDSEILTSKLYIIVRKDGAKNMIIHIYIYGSNKNCRCRIILSFDPHPIAITLLNVTVSFTTLRGGGELNTFRRSF